MTLAQADIWQYSEDHAGDVEVVYSGYVRPGRAWISAFDHDGMELILPDYNNVPSSEVSYYVQELMALDDHPHLIRVFLPDTTTPAF